MKSLTPQELLAKVAEGSLEIVYAREEENGMVYCTARPAKPEPVLECSQCGVTEGKCQTADCSPAPASGWAGKFGWKPLSPEAERLYDGSSI